MKTKFVVEYSFSVQVYEDNFEEFTGYEEVYVNNAEDAEGACEILRGGQGYLNLKTSIFSGKAAEIIKLKHDLPQIELLIQTGSIQTQEQLKILQRLVDQGRQILNT
ncbi:hypothetical protein [Paenibacillus sp. 37]|uniref:hypothetical protein n=1 Tax=Paenibacillus sp. 37 TaxID=2607911 RepID=UPI00122E03E4|nr:hypothetical protein [Paenibacillus sp. 37]